VRRPLGGGGACSAAKIVAGITRQALNKILNQDVKDLKHSTILSLATAANVHPLSLLRRLDVPIESQKPKYPRDYSGFCGETIPDNTIMTINQEFTKTWELVNLAAIPALIRVY